ncbi:MAG: hypothetical protein IAE94_03740 [Chthoniobacterales bacterium]|nr:hypothetical protein [Chthoniobacterales bacterium]
MLPTLASAEELLWELNLGDHAPGVAPELGENLEIREEDGLRMLSKPVQGTQFFPKTILPVQEKAEWKDIVFRVRYRWPQKGDLWLVVKKDGQRGEVPYMQYYVGIHQDGITLQCHGIPVGEVSIDRDDPRVKSMVKFADIGANTLVGTEWTIAEVRVGQESLQVLVSTDDGETRKVEFKTLPGTGGVAILAISPVDVASASVHSADGEVVASEHPQ